MTTLRRRLFGGVSIASAVALTASLIGIAAANAAPGDPGTAEWRLAVEGSNLTVWTYDDPANPDDSNYQSNLQSTMIPTEVSSTPSFVNCYTKPNDPHIVSGIDDLPGGSISVGVVEFSLTKSTIEQDLNEDLFFNFLATDCAATWDLSG